MRHVVADHNLVLSEVVITELRRALRTRIHLPNDEIDDIETYLRDNEVVPKPKHASDVKIRDPDDAWIIASAVDAKADVIVSGDPDLLVLGKASPIPVLTPRQFWTLASGG
jgi:putative PIN family toxin of toxin-antitoxin system